MTVSELRRVLEKFDDDAAVEVQISKSGDEPRWASISGEVEFSPVTRQHCLLRLGNVTME